MISSSIWTPCPNQDYCGDNQRRLIDTYLPPSECHIDNFLVSSEPSPRDVDWTESSLEWNRSCSSPVPEERMNFEPITPNLGGLSSFPSYDYKFNKMRYLQHCSSNGSSVESSFADASTSSSTDSPRPKDEPKSLVKEQKQRSRVWSRDIKSQRSDSSFKDLIIEAILSSSNGLIQVSEIFDYISQKYERYANLDCKSTKNFKCSLRYHLEAGKYFVKSELRNKRRGYFWSIEPHYLQSMGNLWKRLNQPKVKLENWCP